MKSWPSEQEALSYFDMLSNWGRWGKDDERGTLNLITPAKIVEAAKLIRDGTAVSCARNIDPANPDPLASATIVLRYTTLHGGAQGHAANREFIGMIWHGSNTHLDAPSHQSWNGHFYNGFPASSINTAQGASKLSVHQAVTGVQARGVLIDLPAVRGVPWLDPGDGAHPDELEAAEKRQGVTVREGDVVLLYTGHLERIAVHGLPPERRRAGFTAACMPWLHRRGAAVIGADTANDTLPSGYGLGTEEPKLREPVHGIGLVAMGLWLIDNMVLKDLRDTCERKNRYEFFFTMPSLRFVGSTSSLVNPIALF